MTEKKVKANSKPVNTDLVFVKEKFYEPSGLNLQNLQIEPESADYGACSFTLNNLFVRYRKAKITPTKVGQFVTFWKRVGQGPIMPFNINDAFDFLVVGVHAGNLLGQFIFPKVVLCEKGIVSCNGKGGKRAIRVYLPWDKTENSQAKKSQTWQLQFFINFSENTFDSDRIRSLFNMI